MGSLAVGDVVLVNFPYADFSKVKKRPALIVAHAEFDNLILCQITSQAATSKRAIPLKNKQISSGSLGLDSYIRPDKLFTVEQSIVERKVGSLQADTLDTLSAEVRALFTRK